MKAKRVKKLDPRKPLAENAALMIRARVGELCSFAPGALTPDSSREQHDMRIAAKRLRYVLETTEFCFGPEADKARRRARDLQDILGELHDCDVMLPRIQAHVATLRDADATALRELAAGAPDLDPRLAGGTPSRALYRGLQVLAAHVEARRRLLFDRFVEFWAEQERAKTWQRLAADAERVLRLAREERKRRAADQEAGRSRAVATQAS